MVARYGRLARVVVPSVVLATAVTGCATGGDRPVPLTVSRGQIGIALPTTKSPRWIADGDNMVHQLDLLGYTTDLQYAEDDVDKQIAQLDGMVAQNVKALVVGSIDGSKLKDVLQKAAAAKIPVIAYDRLLRDTPNVDYYATFDNFRVGVLQAETIVAKLKLADRAGPFTVELFAGSPDDNNAHVFFAGSMSVLKPYLAAGKLVVGSGQTAFEDIATPRWDGATAQKRMEGLLAGPDAKKRIDAVLSPYDGISRGVITALKDVGYGAGGRPLPVVTGQDAELDSVKLIVGGQQTETVYKDTRELAKVAVQMVDSLAKGGKPAVNDTSQYHNGVKAVPTFLLQPVNVDKSNYQRVLIDGGYYAANQLAA
ncbi:MAG: putative multiple sugar transport system substrate-binding protein [Actinomycetota bacterium]|nr:putative multiple sugar transport system substrate-binding protein [Actinomycetota bacterium]